MSLLKPEALKILSNKENYGSPMKCQICGKDIAKCTSPDHFHLHATSNIGFVTFHFKCAFKPGTAEELETLLPSFDYTHDI